MAADAFAKEEHVRRGENRDDLASGNTCPHSGNFLLRSEHSGEQ